MAKNLETESLDLTKALTVCHRPPRHDASSGQSLLDDAGLSFPRIGKLLTFYIILKLVFLFIKENKITS